MYQPRHFEQQDPQALQALMRRFPLAALVRATPDGSFTADHVPLLHFAEGGEHGVLRGHVARANPLWRELAPGAPVLAIFQGADAYVSPSWYPSKAEHGKVVPTWNYAVVHAHGRLRAIDDAAWVRGFVETLTARQEAGRAAPWAVSDAPADYLEQMLKAIVGIEITLTRLEGKWKASQNRSAAERAGVISGLRADGDEASAVLVERSAAN